LNLEHPAIDVEVNLLALVQRARTVSGEPGTTSAEREAARMAGVRTFLTTVRRVETIHDGLRLVTFANPPPRLDVGATPKQAKNDPS